MSPKINPNAVMIMWALTIVMAGAIALGPLAIKIVIGVIVAYIVLALLMGAP